MATLAELSPEKGLKLYLEASLTADRFATTAKKDGESDYSSISYELLTQAIALYEEQISDGKVQYRCIAALSGTLLALQSINKEDYESLITKTAQFSAKVLKKPDQCQLVALCAHLFYPVQSSSGERKYSNPQRALECLQRSLKLADACTSMNPAYIHLFVDLLEHYVFFFEKKNPLITHAYVTGLVALIKEHLGNLNAIGSDGEAKAQFLEIVRYIQQRKIDADAAEMFSEVQIGA